MGSSGSYSKTVLYLGTVPGYITEYIYYINKDSLGHLWKWLYTIRSLSDLSFLRDSREVRMEKSLTQYVGGPNVSRRSRQSTCRLCHLARIENIGV